MNISSYASFEKSKTNISIPIFLNGKAACSLYDPEKEADNFSTLPEFSKSQFFIIGGCGCGLHIKKLEEKYPNAVICVLEDTIETLEFWKTHTQYHPKNCTFCTFTTLEETILKTYYPPFHGDFCFKTLRSWENFHKNKTDKILFIIKNALKKISADISVQSHFGKLWHRNIILNYKLCSLPDIKLVDFYNSSFPLSKKAIVCGAGPGLDYSLKNLKTNRKNYYIVATDTSYQVLLEHAIIADALVTADAQHISLYHFSKGIFSNTLYISDLSGSAVAARIAYKNKCPILFYNGGHPLSSYISLLNKKNIFPQFSAGSGSVTLAAIDFITKAGFSKFEVLGADFSYLNGKTYTNGTYLDILYNIKACRFLSIEKQFCSLMFRTPLKNEIVKIRTLSYPLTIQGCTTEVLESYRASFNKFMLLHNKTTKDVNTPNKITHNLDIKFMLTPFDFEFFKNSFITDLNKLLNSENLTFFTIPKSIYPYCAFTSRLNSNSISDIKKTLVEIINKTKKLCGD